MARFKGFGGDAPKIRVPEGPSNFGGGAPRSPHVAPPEPSASRAPEAPAPAPSGPSQLGDTRPTPDFTPKEPSLPDTPAGSRTPDGPTNHGIQPEKAPTTHSAPPGSEGAGGSGADGHAGGETPGAKPGAEGGKAASEGAGGQSTGEGEHKPADGDEKPAGEGEKPAGEGEKFDPAQFAKDLAKDVATEGVKGLFTLATTLAGNGSGSSRSPSTGSDGAGGGANGGAGSGGSAGGGASGTAGNDVITVDVAALRLHAQRLESYAQQIAGQRQVADGVNLWNGAFGLFCLPLIIPATQVTEAVKSGISQLADVVHSAADQVRAAANDFEHIEASQIDQIQGLNTNLADVRTYAGPN